jgi:hypothetical protein
MRQKSKLESLAGINNLIIGAFQVLEWLRF